MSEHSPENPPGHLDIDAVSAYIDRDFGPDDLTTIEIHLTQCPACHREVLEIHTTVTLLAGLPQYEPRRSFCLGHEHARAGRRQGRRPHESAFSPVVVLPGQLPWQPPVAAIGAPRFAGWLPGLHAAALVVGALLLMVTVGDLTGISPGSSTPIQLAAPTALAESSPRFNAMPADEASVARKTDAEEADNSAALKTTSSFQAADQSDGTVGGDSASEGVPAGEAPAPRLAATVAVASVTRAAANRSAVDGQRANPASAPAGAETSAASAGQPSRLRMVQLTLAIVFAWLIVSIAGLRWVRRLR